MLEASPQLAVLAIAAASLAILLGSLALFAVLRAGQITREERRRRGD